MGADEQSYITFTCQCGQVLRTPAEHAGRKGRCKVCGRKMIIPVPAGKREPDIPPNFTGGDLRREQFAEDDLITYPERLLAKSVGPPTDVLRETPSLFHMLGDILRYPISNKTATQIFLSGAILFSPLMWKVVHFTRFLCCLWPIAFFVVISFRLMYFSYLLLVIEKSAEGGQKIPELPVFQTWQENLRDLMKVLAATAIAFLPYLVYAFSVNIEFLGKAWEAAARGQPLTHETFSGVSSSIGMLVLLYAIAAFYMPMVLMALVVTKNFLKAVNPAFILHSIVRMRREYLVAMIIIFLGLRGSLTLFTIIKDVLDVDWFTAFAANLGEPIIEFYVLVVTMHVIGLLYYRNGDKLNW
jgi:hypothetical protein